MPHNAENDTFMRLTEWLPAEALRDPRFVVTIQRTIAEEQPTTAVEECALARVIEGIWRLRPSMRLSNQEHAAADSQQRARVERELARAEVAWMRHKRFAASEARARARACTERSSTTAAQYPPRPETAAPAHAPCAERPTALTEKSHGHKIAGTEQIPPAAHNTNRVHTPQNRLQQQCTSPNPSPSSRKSQAITNYDAACPVTLDLHDLAPAGARLQPALDSC